MTWQKLLAFRMREMKESKESFNGKRLEYREKLILQKYFNPLQY